MERLNLVGATGIEPVMLCGKGFTAPRNQPTVTSLPKLEYHVGLQPTNNDVADRYFEPLVYGTYNLATLMGLEPTFFS